jgi:DNA-binding GntR family transcriptional regulator
MDYKSHCLECKQKLGKDWAVVHRWLDEFACNGLNWHRGLRHHLDGVEEVRRMWGDQAAEAARLHIEADFGVVPSREEVHRMVGFSKD